MIDHCCDICIIFLIPGKRCICRNQSINIIKNHFRKVTIIVYMFTKITIGVIYSNSL